MWAIEAAAGNGNVELVRALVAVGLDVKSPEATRALVQAAGAGHLPVVKLLVQEGADLEATSGGETALDAPAPTDATTWCSSSRKPPRSTSRSSPAAAKPSGPARRSSPIAFPAG